MEISDAEFWKTVADINWADKKKNQEHTYEKLALMWGPEKSEAFHTKASSFKSALYRAIEHWERNEDGHVDASDDGMSDLTNHIIGLGEEEYNKVMKSPQLAAERAERGDYRESFGYLIPSRWTFEHNWARLPEREAELLGQLADIRKNSPAIEMLVDEVEAMVQRAGSLPMTNAEILTRFKAISSLALVAEAPSTAISFFTGWAYVNYITDMQKIGNARRELAEEAKSKV